MTTTTFDPSELVITVRAYVWGPRGHSELNLVLDTGSTHTLIVPEVLDELGFNPRDGLAITGVHSAVGKEQGYLLEVPRFSALGFSVSDFPIHVFELADHYDIDGLVGLSFLHRFNYLVRSADGQILVEPVGPESGAVPVD